MLACLTAACLLPERAEEPAQPDQPEKPTEPEKHGAGGKPSAGGTDPSAPAAVNPMDRPAASPAIPATSPVCCISKKGDTNK